MKSIVFILCIGLTLGKMFGQVGIGTVNPTNSSMLEVSSTSDGGATYKGFMPPRVPNIAARDAINVNSMDYALTVFVEDIQCLQIYNGSGWENIHCNNNIGFVDLFQNFDLNTSWAFSSDIPFFNNGNSGFYGITDNLRFGFDDIVTLTNNFLGIFDLDDEGNNGTNQFATITFSPINVSAASNGTTLSFDYEFFEFDNGDDAYYSIIIDGIQQPEVTLIEGLTNLSISGSISENIPAGTTTVALSLRIKQEGAMDSAGFDNFAVVAN